MTEVPAAVLQGFGIADAKVERFGTGLINDTYLVGLQDGGQRVLQALNPVFDPRINTDIDTLTRHLESKGFTTQRLCATKDGALWVETGKRAWRMASFIPGMCYDSLASGQQASEAGRLLANFHRAVSDLDIELHNKRLGVHDTGRHLAALHTALEEHRGHRNFATVNAIAQAVFDAADDLPALPELPDRLVHGDPKISNLVFDADTGTGICLIDLDTLAHMPVPLELGDAFRSWCNPRGEDTEDTLFRIDLFTEAVAGYAGNAHNFLSSGEQKALVPATRAIMVELAARFTTDALNESYFGWNPDLFADRSTHNQARAAGQLKLHRSLCEQLSEAEAAVERAFS
ncbi:MAG: phosphotransferase [Gammaproteobacteria bacterium]|nr:phosphotransferase [Gammaproteobacteria bacterium]MDP6617121.1 phosphotransferase [Gammaproteobacteria bacterium]MDP6695769.1 phosphotransferase [Gammaproteobacteria bacterium]